MTTKVRRVATYERVSTVTQAERETIKAQTSALEQRLAIEQDVTVVKRSTRSETRRHQQ
jgi:hypothetical protein